MSENVTTIDGSTAAEGGRQRQPGICLTLLWHPDAGRIGARCFVRLPRGGGAVDLSRVAPVFDDGRPLDDPHVSRSPLQLVPDGEGGLRLYPGKPGLRYAVAGARGTGGERVAGRALQAGVVLALGRGALLLVERGWSLRAASRHGLVGASHGLERVRVAIDTAARSDRAVLVRGASGTGKELVARALHGASPRAAGPLVAVNLAALPPSTAASQLFGHPRGAFTGAVRASTGYFGQAEGGTLFLDELGACPTELQAMLLRALESSEVQPVGGATRAVDVRVVAATDEDLEAAIADGRFRGPLYYRLAERRVDLPPLRERLADVAVQAVHFLQGARAAAGLDPLGPPGGGALPWLGRSAMEALLAHPWPGNTRELRSVAERMVEEFGPAPTCRHVPLDPVAAEPPTPARPAARPSAPAPDEPVDLQAALAEHDYAIRATARALGMGINTLRRRMADEGLPRPRDLTGDAIRRALQDHATVEEVARALRVSVRGLKLRAAELQLSVADGAE